MSAFIQTFDLQWPPFALLALLQVVAALVLIPWIILKKREPVAAVAWCLVVLLIPYVGPLSFWMFGDTHVARPLRQKQHPPRTREAVRRNRLDSTARPC